MRRARTVSITVRSTVTRVRYTRYGCVWYVDRTLDHMYSKKKRRNNTNVRKHKTVWSRANDNDDVKRINYRLSTGICLWIPSDKEGIRTVRSNHQPPLPQTPPPPSEPVSGNEKKTDIRPITRVVCTSGEI